ncbi:hypothetical protein PSm6_20660 [Pseudomonas solani]|uniref:Uncharacterized protein n=1 Tax=Pseudomonas solani TaxID=2731552 RepID=A0AAU7Y5F8_9PSED|nr:MULTISPECIES: hypothetical protein [Pseudomonas]EQM68814.1 hypothetical protein L682_02265 [Pseudomonas alcaligenes OT 69]MDN4143438.1 hypothetical protein [Pseudomonas tohonis]MCU9946273.1 hypothetical protein [Pseudomonas sp. PDM13]MDU9411331.1 hypothetical protein [Pseudomonas sp. zfem005]WCD80489.1 hypothetical protein PI990_00325 [Pseudomonas sp. TUM22785]
MPTFTRNKLPVVGSLELVVGNVLKLKLNGLGPGKKHYRIKSANTCLEVKQDANDRQSEQSITIKALRACQSVRVEAFSAVDDLPSGIHVVITVLEALTLPDGKTDEGCLARLLLAESVVPKNAGGLEEALFSMQLMRQVIENRMAFSEPKHFGKPANKTMTGFITARDPLQFEGFGNYPAIGAKEGKIDSYLRLANDGSDLRFSFVRQHVQNALDVAAGKSVAKPYKPPVYGWMTEGSDPGGYFIKAVDKGGQTFFSLTQAFIDNPNNPGKPKK